MKFEKNTDREVVLEGMVEIEFPDGNEEGFRKVKETLQRIGIPSNKNKTLYQTAHILHKKGVYRICHFKELFALDGRESEISDADYARRNLIIKMLEDWNLIEPVGDPEWRENVASPKALKVLQYGDREKWSLESKYAIGVR